MLNKLVKKSQTEIEKVKKGAEPAAKKQQEKIQQKEQVNVNQKTDVIFQKTNQIKPAQKKPLDDDEDEPEDEIITPSQEIKKVAKNTVPGSIRADWEAKERIEIELKYPGLSPEQIEERIQQEKDARELAEEERKRQEQEANNKKSWLDRIRQQHEQETAGVDINSEEFVPIGEEAPVKEKAVVKQPVQTSQDVRPPMFINSKKNVQEKVELSQQQLKDREIEEELLKNKAYATTKSSTEKGSAEGGKFQFTTDPSRAVGQQQSFTNSKKGATETKVELSAQQVKDQEIDEQILKNKVYQIKTTTEGSAEKVAAVESDKFSLTTDPSRTTGQPRHFTNSSQQSAEGPKRENYKPVEITEQQKKLQEIEEKTKISYANSAFSRNKDSSTAGSSAKASEQTAETVPSKFTIGGEKRTFTNTHKQQTNASEQAPAQVSATPVTTSNVKIDEQLIKQQEAERKALQAQEEARSRFKFSANPSQGGSAVPRFTNSKQKASNETASAQPQESEQAPQKAE